MKCTHLQFVPPTSFSSDLYLPSSTPFTHMSHFDIPDVFLNTNIFPQNTSSPDPSTTFDISSSQHIIPQENKIRHSTRPKKPPSYLNDYHCNMSMPHWCNLVSDLHDVTEIKEPETYEQAILDSKWITAMNTEIQALKDNQTWEEVPLPTGKKAIRCKWVYKIKLRSNGEIERYKARLVAKGYTQKPGIDYDETFSPVIKMPTLRCILALATHNNWIVSQLDINNAFLHGDLIEEVYMHMPKGIANTDNKVCKLKKSLYGLKQASRQWYAKLVTALQSQGFTPSKSDYSLFLKKYNGQLTIAAVYVDDILLTGTDSNTITALKTHLHSLFSIKDLGPIHYFLGMTVTKANQGFILSQTKFAQDLIKCSGFEIQKTSPTPLPINLKLHTDKGHIIPNPSHYRYSISSQIQDQI